MHNSSTFFDGKVRDERSPNKGHLIKQIQDNISDALPWIIILLQ